MPIPSASASRLAITQSQSREVPATVTTTRCGMLVGMVKSTPIELAHDVAEALSERGPELGGHDVLLLPSQTRNDRTFYVEDDLDAPALAGSVGLNLGYLNDGADRRYLHENAAGWELNASFAIAESITAGGILALAGYLWTRVHRAKDHGAYGGEEASAPIKLKLAQLKRDAPGDVTITVVELEGRLDEVVATLDHLFEQPLQR